MATQDPDLSNDSDHSQSTSEKLRDYLLVAIAHLGLASLFTHPLLWQARDHTAVADMSSDQFQTIWSFWWMKRALFELGQNPYWTDAIYYPHGTGLGYHLSAFTSLSAVVVSAITSVPINSPFIYNILLFASFIVTGLGVYALTRFVTCSRYAALIASVFVAVSPFRLWHLNHLNLLSLGWGVWTIYFAVRFLACPKLRTMLAAVLFFAITFYSSMTMAAFVALLLVAYAILRLPKLSKYEDKARLLRGVVLGVILTAAVLSLGLLELDRTDSEWNLHWQDTVGFSADPQGWVVPSANGSLLSQWIGTAGTSRSYRGGQEFLGWLLPLGALLTLIFGWRAVPRLWLILGGIFLVTSLGPSLKVSGNVFFDGWLPFRWLFEYIPYLGFSRIPMRFATLAHLCLAIYTAQGLARWIKHLRHDERLQNLVPAVMSVGAALIIGVLFVESTAGSTTIVQLPIPSVYYETRRDPSINAIYEGPITGASQICNLYMYCQTIHEKKVANGYLTHPSRGARTLLDQITSTDSLSVIDRFRLRSAGVDAMIYHDPSGEGTLIPLR
jgi:hypothetical protein